MRFARGTPWRFIHPQVVAAGLLLALGGALPFEGGRGTSFPAAEFFLAFGVIACGWVTLLVLFFRDPDRTLGPGVVSPADGRVATANLEGDRANFSIILGIFDVHVIRAPLMGNVSRLERRSGGKRLAFSKESEHNERVVLEINGEGGPCTLTLIAGAFADRIEPYVAEGDAVAKGDRVGIIKFGSRVDVVCRAPAPLDLRVKVGDTVKAGLTPLLAPPREAAHP